MEKLDRGIACESAEQSQCSYVHLVGVRTKMTHRIRGSHDAEDEFERFYRVLEEPVSLVVWWKGRCRSVRSKEDGLKRAKVYVVWQTNHIGVLDLC